jgi:hypothetical protein
MKLFLILFFGIFSFVSANDLQTLLISSVKLQAPTSAYNKKYSILYGGFKKSEFNKYFHIKGNSVVFNVCGFKKRSEFRFKKEWNVQTPRIIYLSARIKLYPLSCEREFTFMQIHADPKKNSPNKPLLRVVWFKKHGGLKNYIFAVLKLKNGYSFIPLTDLQNPFTLKLEIKKSVLKIYVNNKLKAVKNVSYWNGYYNYFKLGVYNQCKGCSKSVFEDIETNTIFFQDKGR